MKKKLQSSPFADSFNPSQGQLHSQLLQIMDIVSNQGYTEDSNNGGCYLELTESLLNCYHLASVNHNLAATKFQQNNNLISS